MTMSACRTVICHDAADAGYCFLIMTYGCEWHMRSVLKLEARAQGHMQEQLLQLMQLQVCWTSMEYVYYYAKPEFSQLSTP